MIIDGDFLLKENNTNFTVVAIGVAWNLDINLNDTYKPISVYVPKRSKKVILNPINAFNNKVIYPSGVFSVQQDIDSKYIIYDK